MIVQKAPRRWRRIWLYLGILVGIPPCFLVGLFLVAHYAGERDLALALAETDKLDPNWRLEGLEAYRRPMPPPGENAYEDSDRVRDLKKMETIKMMKAAKAARAKK
jgi:hypothetical protein